jgi:tRNA/tmRNA/rRNA uracil-C5-methylase (TrmA/RlmC/RlmD family)
MVRTQWDKPRQCLNFGFLRADNRLVIDVAECKIAEPAINRQLQEVRAHPPPKGGIKVVLRIPPEGWEVPPDSFFQNNFFLLPKLVEVVRERFLNSGARYLVDVYCGVGFFSIELANVAETYAGVEYDGQAIKAARRNAALRSRTNGRFLAGKAEDLLADVLKEFPASATTVLLDPPRKGCPADLLNFLRSARPAQIIYISCHPATMARDLNVLCGEGVFKLAQVVPLDMFPQTAHIECVADLRSESAVPATPERARN